MNMITNTPNHILNITATDVTSEIDSLWYNWAGINLTYVVPIEIEFAEGSNTIYAWVNDTMGNVEMTSVSFIVDPNAPSLTINSPLPTIYNNTSGLLNISASDENGLDSIWFNWDGLNHTYSGSPEQIVFTEGMHTLYAWANDSIGNLAMTSVSFVIDITAPDIQILSPIASYNGSVNQWLEISSSDENGLSTVWYNWAGTNITYSGPGLVEFTEGTHTLYVWANDSVGNLGSTSIVFTIDLTPPTLQINSPLTLIYNQTSLTVTLDASDDQELNTTWYNWAGTNITYDHALDISFPEGFHTLYAWANDSAGHLISTSVTFTIDLTPPTLYIDSPMAGFNNSLDQWVDISSSDTNGLSTVWYNWAGTNISYSGLAWSCGIYRR